MAASYAAVRRKTLAARPRLVASETARPGARHLRDDGGVIHRVAEDHHMGVVLGRGAQQRGPADVDLLDESRKVGSDARVSSNG